MNLVDACALKSGENSSPWAGVHHLGPLLLRPKRGAPGDGPRPREERPERERRSEWRRRQASRTASAFLGVGGDIHTLMSSPGPRPRGGMMPQNDTGDAAMRPMHDDDLPVDPIIPQNRGARRGRELPVTTELYRIRLRSGHEAQQDGSGGALADTAVASLAMSITCSEKTAGSDREDLDSRIHRATSTGSCPNASDAQVPQADCCFRCPPQNQLALELILWLR
jgi:hypothetical protein